MVALVVGGVALGFGVDWRIVAAGLVMVVVPPFGVVAGLLLAVVWAVRRRVPLPGPAVEAAFRTAVAAELRGGASLRGALRDAAAATPDVDLASAVRLAGVGADMTRVAEALGPVLPVTGRAASVAIELSAQSGARAASLFDALAERAVFEAEMSREQRAVTAQARLSAVVVGAGPLLFGVVLLATGRGQVLLQHGTAGIIAGGVGVGLQVAGLLIVVLVLRRNTA